MDEIKKCICLCSNCHRVLHADPQFERKVYAKVEELGLFSKDILRALKDSVT
jgi:predicted HNH restriction endonuclease